MKYRSNVPKYSEFLFEVLDPKFHDRAKSIKEGGDYNVIVGGLSYGQGSSREHAALCPMYMGVKALITKSYERIHIANLINFGIIPFIFDNPDDIEKLDQGDKLLIEKVHDIIKGNGKAIVKNTTKGTEFKVSAALSDRQKDVILAGGMLNYIKEQSK